MTELLYLKDSYLKEAAGNVVSLGEGCVELDRTIFYPRGGGQPSDTGTLEQGGKTFRVKEVLKKDGRVLHFIEGGELPALGAVTERIDWGSRYIHMRMHTASHVLAQAFFKNAGVLVTGNQIGPEKTRFDFALEDFDRELMQTLIGKANEELKKGHAISVSELPREEAMKIEGISKMAAAFPPNIPVLRIVKIGDFDMQADGGTHVRNTSEVGEIEAIKFENMGKNNRRMYFRLR
ncbi:MAG: alanyl-tRNA editing protein [Candidatus Bilamarchaeaceae archaeon]